MRAGMVVLVCALAACDARNGTYFTVDGEAAGITFDQLEFFLGKNAGGSTPHTPGSPFNPAVTPAPNERQRLTKRVFSDSDVQTTPETTSLTYFLPPEFATTDASYVLVVASRGGVPVGLAEVERFNVHDDGAYVYEVALGPLDAGFERWGVPRFPAGDCVRWTRQREGEVTPSTYAVVRSDDYDCDSSRSSADCDDLNFCDPAPGNTCARRTTGCITETCDLGVCIDGDPAASTRKACEPMVCLPDAFCAPDDQCRETDSAMDFLACAISLPPVHTEVLMPVKALDGALCAHTFEVLLPDNVECQDPEILWPPMGKVVDWQIIVEPATVPPGGCAFTLQGPTVDAPPPTAHVIVSVRGPTMPPRRTSFVIGFTPYTTPPLSCTLQAVSITQPTTPTAPTCP